MRKVGHFTSMTGENMAKRCVVYEISFLGETVFGRRLQMGKGKQGVG